MKRRLVVVSAALALAGVAPNFAPVGAGAPLATSVAAAHSCSSGFRHAVISGSHKCLRRGQFCARSADRQYHRYGFHCHKYDRRARRYRLT